MLIVSGCATRSGIGTKNPPSKLNTSNLVKDPDTGIYKFKNTNSVSSFFKKEIEDGLTAPPRTNVIQSIDLPTPRSNQIQTNKPSQIVKTQESKDNIKTNTPTVELWNETKPIDKPIVKNYSYDLSKLILYYLIVFHILAVFYVAYKRGFFEKINNPFKDKTSSEQEKN